jgi:cobalt/nickel transport system ATP-binding protein
MKIPLFAILPAGIFAIQAINLPLGVGVSGHMVGAVLVSIIFASPYAGLLLLTFVLFVQAFVFADGGITALGANIFNMGVVSSWVGYYAYTAFKRLGITKASFVGAWLGIFIPSIVITFEIYFAGTIPLIEALIIMGTFHAIIGIICESPITALTVRSLMILRPDLLKVEDVKSINSRHVALSLTLVFVLVITAPFVASSNPDGLEKSMIQLISSGDESELEAYLEENADLSYHTPLSGYSIPGLGVLGEVISLISGTLILLVFGLFAARISQKTIIQSKVRASLHTTEREVKTPSPVESPASITLNTDSIGPIIEINHLTYQYPGSSTKALDNISLKICAGEKIAILGANGSGKTTLFKLLNGILKPVSGEVLIKGEKISKKRILDVRRTVGIVFQNPDDQIIAPTVEQDVAFGPMNMGLPEDEIKARVKEAIELVNMSGLEDRAPHHLSGGQKKLVAIAGILAMRPEVVILDEPTAGLDPLSAGNILNIIDEMNRVLGMTVLLSTHDVDIVPVFSDRICIVHHGRLEAQGSPIKIFKDRELLKKSHLRMPRIAEVFKLLQDDGIDIEIKITPDDAKAELLRVINLYK